MEQDHDFASPTDTPDTMTDTVVDSPIKPYHERVRFFVTLKYFDEQFPHAIPSVYYTLIILCNLAGYVLMFVGFFQNDANTSVVISGVIAYAFSVLLLLFQKSDAFAYISMSRINFKTNSNASGTFSYWWGIVFVYVGCFEIVVSVVVFNVLLEQGVKFGIFGGLLMILICVICNVLLILRYLIVGRYTNRYDRRYDMLYNTTDQTNTNETSSQTKRTTWEWFLLDRGGNYDSALKCPLNITFFGLFYNVLADNALTVLNSSDTLNNNDIELLVMAMYFIFALMATLCYATVTILAHPFIKNWPSPELPDLQNRSSFLLLCFGVIGYIFYTFFVKFPHILNTDIQTNNYRLMLYFLSDMFSVTATLSLLFILLVNGVVRVIMVISKHCKERHPENFFTVVSKKIKLIKKKTNEDLIQCTNQSALV